MSEETGIEWWALRPWLKEWDDQSKEVDWMRAPLHRMEAARTDALERIAKVLEQNLPQLCNPIYEVTDERIANLKEMVKGMPSTQGSDDPLPVYTSLRISPNGFDVTVGDGEEFHIPSSATCDWMPQSGNLPVQKLVGEGKHTNFCGVCSKGIDYMTSGQHICYTCRKRQTPDYVMPEDRVVYFEDLLKHRRAEFQQKLESWVAKGDELKKREEKLNAHISGLTADLRARTRERDKLADALDLSRSLVKEGQQKLDAWVEKGAEFQKERSRLLDRIQDLREEAAGARQKQEYLLAENQALENRIGELSYQLEDMARANKELAQRAVSPDDDQECSSSDWEDATRRILDMLHTTQQELADERVAHEKLRKFYLRYYPIDQGNLSIIISFLEAYHRLSSRYLREIPEELVSVTQNLRSNLEGMENAGG